MAILLCSSFACSAPALGAEGKAADELLRAPGFEEMASAPLKIDSGDWAINSAYPGKAAVVEDAKAAHSGRRYLTVSKPEETDKFVSVLASQAYPNHGKPFALKVWAKGSGKIMLALINLKGKDFLPPQDGGPKPEWLALTEEWQEYSTNLFPSESATRVMVCIHATVQADLDDASLKSEGEVASLSTTVAPNEETAGDGYKNDFSKDQVDANWKSATAVGQFLWNKNEGHSGQGALEITIGDNCPDNAEFCFTKHFTVVPGKTYNAVVWVRAENLTADANVSLSFQGKDAEMKFLGTAVMETVLPERDIVEGWQRRVLTFTVPHEGSWAKARFLLCTFGVRKSSQGRVLFDDLEFFESK